jgi:hypothetical protein
MLGTIAVLGLGRSRAREVKGKNDYGTAAN